jgi:hypothetical protein
LNRNGEKGSARNPARPEGVQKSTSVISGRAAWNVYQPWSVIAIAPCNGTPRSGTGSARLRPVRPPRESSTPTFPVMITV